MQPERLNEKASKGRCDSLNSAVTSRGSSEEGFPPTIRNFRIVGQQVTEWPYMIHSIPAEQKYMPAHGGRTLRMRRYNPLPTAVVPLGNSGVLPPPVTISAVDI